VVLFKQNEKQEGNMEVREGQEQTVLYEDVEAGILIKYKGEYYIAGEDENAMSVEDGTLIEIKGDESVSIYFNAYIVI
jgi:hypothetical protein